MHAEIKNHPDECPELAEHSKSALPQNIVLQSTTPPTTTPTVAKIQPIAAGRKASAPDLSELPDGEAPPDDEECPGDEVPDGPPLEAALVADVDVLVSPPMYDAKSGQVMFVSTYGCV
jgi:hypothetical protein